MFERPGRLADYFPAPFPNEQAARAANGGAYPPDLSVIAKARTYERGFPRFLLDVVTQYQEQGVDYMAALLKGYEDAPQGMQMAQGMMYNKYFPGHGIAMPPPLSDGQVTYDDDTPGTVDQYSRDVSAFLAWTAEPHLEARKRLGFQVVIFLLVLSGLLYFGIWLVARGGFGFGDVRFAPLVGAATAAHSWSLLIWAMLLGSILGALYGVVRLARRRAGPFPYAPAMLAGAYLACGTAWAG